MNRERKISNYKHPDVEFVIVETEQGFLISGGIENIGKDEETEF